MLRLQEIKDLRKSGKLEESLKLALEDLEGNPENLYAKRNIGWVYNDFLKRFIDEENFEKFVHTLEKVHELQMPETEVMLFDILAWKIGSILFKISKKKDVPFQILYKIVDLAKSFHYSKPSEGYSFMLKAVHKALKTNREKYLSFIDWWGTENLRAEDYEKEVLPNGKLIISLAEQVFTAYYKAQIPSADYPLEKEKVLENVNAIDEIFEKHHSFIYLIYFKVQMLLAVGERENILKEFLPFAQKKSGEFWVWDLLSQIVEGKEAKLTCLCMACLSGNKVEQMKTNLYLKMAQFFISINMYPEAKREILKIHEIKKQNGQNIPAKVLEYSSTNWFQETTPTDSNVNFYESHSQEADAILYSDAPSHDIFVFNINPEKKIVNFITENDEIGFFKHGFINKRLSIEVGDILNVRFAQFSKENISKLQTLKKGENRGLIERNLKKETGTVRLYEKGFAFLNNTFISPDAVKKLALRNDQEISVIAMRKYSRKKDDLVWEVLKLA